MHAWIVQWDNYAFSFLEKERQNPVYFLFNFYPNSTQNLINLSFAIIFGPIMLSLKKIRINIFLVCTSDHGGHVGGT